MRHQPQFDSDSDRKKRVDAYVREEALNILAVIVSVLIIAAITIVSLFGPVIDTACERFLK